MPQLPALGLGVVLQVNPGALHQETPPHHGQAEPGRRPRREAVVELHGALSAPGRHLRVEAGREELDGARGRRYRIGAVGQLPEQTDEREDFRDTTRTRCSKAARTIRRCIDGRYVPLKRNWSNFLSFADNKADVAHFLSEELCSQAPVDK